MEKITKWGKEFPLRRKNNLEKRGQNKAEKPKKPKVKTSKSNDNGIEEA